MIATLVAVSADGAAAGTRPATTGATTRPAGAGAAGAGARVEVDLSRLRPTAQERMSAVWWVERALEQAALIESERERERAYWRVGVAAFDCGRFDLVRRIMAMDLLTDQDQGTLGGRLVEAYVAAGDVERVLELAGTLRESGFERGQSFERAALVLAEKGDPAAAERVIDERMPAGRRLDPYLRLATRAAERGELERTWRLAEKAAKEEQSSAAPNGYLIYLEAAASAKKPAEVERAVAAALAVGEGWGSERMRGSLRVELAQALRRVGMGERARPLEDEARRLGVEPDSGGGQKDAEQARGVDELVEAGKFDDAAKLARAVADPYERAVALARVAEGVAAARASPAARTAAGLAGEARRAMRTALATPARAPERDAEAFPGQESEYAVRRVAMAFAAAGDAAGAVEVVKELPDAQGRLRVLAAATRERARAGDAAFVRAALGSADVTAAGEDARDALRFTLALAHLGGGGRGPAVPAADRGHAGDAAASIRDPYLRACALLAVGQAHVKAGDVAALDRTLAAARQAIATIDEPYLRQEPTDRVAELQAQTLQLEAVWETVRREPAPARRVSLMLAAASGLLGRLNEPPWWGTPAGR